MINRDLERMKRDLASRKRKYPIFLCVNRFLFTVILTIVCLIMFKKDSRFKDLFFDKVLSTNFNFAYIDNLYNKYFSSKLPFFDMISSEEVFNEKLNYDGFTSYLDGVSLNVSSNYLVPTLDSGLVVFVGNKDGYGNTVIIQQSNGIDVWYSNMTNIDVSLYKYVSKGDFIGEANSYLYLVFKKDGKPLDYQRYI